MRYQNFLVSLSFCAVLATGMFVSPGAMADVTFDFMSTSVTEPGSGPISLKATLVLTDAAYLHGSANGSDMCDPAEAGPPCNGVNFVDNGIVRFSSWIPNFPFLGGSNFGASHASLEFGIDANGLLSGSIDMHVNFGGTSDLHMFGSGGVWSGTSSTDQALCFDTCTFEGVWTAATVPEPSSIWLLLVAVAALPAAVGLSHGRHHGYEARLISSNTPNSRLA